MDAVVQNIEGTKLPELHTAEETSKYLKGLLSAKRIEELADAGYMPCWRIDKGRPLFHYGDVKRYVSSHLTVQQPGMAFPRVLPVPILPPHEVSPPPELSRILHLRAYSEHLFPPCVYFLVKARKIVYVGQTVNIASRSADHRKSKDFDEVFFLPVPPSDLLDVEAAFIRLFRPPLNGTNSGVNKENDPELLGRFVIKEDGASPVPTRDEARFLRTATGGARRG
jgi:hypothetical protein